MAISEPTLAMLDKSSPLTSTPYMSTNATEDRSPSTSFTYSCAEPLEKILDTALLSSEKSTSQSPSPASSYDIKTPKADEEDKVELPSLHSLFNLNLLSSPPDPRNTQSQKSLIEPALKIQGWAEVPDPNGSVSLLELFNHELDA